MLGVEDDKGADGDGADVGVDLLPDTRVASSCCRSNPCQVELVRSSN